MLKILEQKLRKKAKFDEDSYELKMLKVDDLISEEKTLKEQKEESEKLHIKTKKQLRILVMHKYMNYLN